MASNSEYEQKRCFDDKKLKRIDGGVDGRETWKVDGKQAYNFGLIDNYEIHKAIKEGSITTNDLIIKDKIEVVVPENFGKLKTK